MINRTIGLVGGMGSFATLDFFKRVLLHYPAEKEWDRPRVIIDNYCTMPSRVRAILYKEREQELLDDLIASITNLVKIGCTDVILTCNTSHYFLNKILQSNSNLKEYVVNVVDVCIKSIEDSGLKDLYLVATEGTIATGLYTKSLSNIGVNVIVPDDRELIEIRKFIEAVKQNSTNDGVRSDFIKFINTRKSQNILLGCTEMPPLYSEVKDNINKNILDPVEYALNELDRRFNI